MGSTKSTLNNLDKKLVEKYQELTKLSADEIQEWHQEFCRECPEKKLTKSKFTSIFIKYFRRHHAEPFCDAIFYLYDRDKDGSLDFEEFLLALSPTSQLEFKAHIRVLLDVYDLSQNDALDEKELITMIKAMYDFVDTNEPAHKEDMQQIARAIISKCRKKPKDKEFDKAAVAEGCYHNPDIRRLLAPYLTDDNANEKQKNVSTSTDDLPQTEKSNQSSGAVQSRSSTGTTISGTKETRYIRTKFMNGNQIHIDQK